MPLTKILLTADLNMIQHLRQKFAGTMLLYVAPEIETLRAVLELKNLRSFYADSRFFTDDIKNFACGGEFSCDVFNGITEIERLLEDDLQNSDEFLYSSKSLVLSDSSDFYSPVFFDDKSKTNFSERKILQNTLTKSKKENKKSENPKIKSESFDKIIGDSDAVFEFRRKIVKAAQTDLPVLIVGETGSGKTLAANAIHELSERKNEKILEINMTEISESLFETTLFGHKKGAFTGAESEHRGIFEEAQNTTLFLDEIGELPKSLQAKLLRVIDKKEFFPVGSSRAKQTDARLVFATNSNLQKKVAEGEFRQDLYRRIKNLLIEVPPLRIRKQDIPLIASEYMKKHGKGKRLSLNALRILQTHSWPENIGELENCLNRAIVFCENDEIDSQDIEF